MTTEGNEVAVFVGIREGRVARVAACSDVRTRLPDRAQEVVALQT